MSGLTAAMSEIFAANVTTMFERSGQTQVVFAERVGISQASLSRWMKGEQEPRHEQLARIAKMAGVTAEDFNTKLLSGPAPAPLRLVESGGDQLFLRFDLPSVEILTAMFEGMLAHLKNERDQGVIAERLARLLPNALAQAIARGSFGRPDPDSPETPLPDDPPPPPASRKP